MPKLPPFAAVLAVFVSATAAALVGAAPAAALPQTGTPAGMDAHVALWADAPPAPSAPILLRGSRGLLDLVHELERASPSAAFMVRTLRERGVPVTFGTFEEMEISIRSAFRSYDPGRSRALGYMAPRVRNDRLTGTLATDDILVALNLTRMDELFAQARSEHGATAEWSRIERLEILALLAHEIAHAYGLVVSGGDPRGGCSDPREGEEPETACVVIAENLVRRELGAPLDWGYGLPSAEDLVARYDALARRSLALRTIEEQSLAWSRTLQARTAFVTLPALPIPGAP